MEIPKIFTKDDKKYYFVEKCKNFVRYQTAKGVCECFNYHDLGLIEETIAIQQRKQYREGIMFFKNII